MKTKLLQLLTFAFFACGIGAFVWYQSGYESNAATYQSSHNGGTLTNRSTDSLNQKKRDSVMQRILSSSKIVITDPTMLNRMIDSRLKYKPVPVAADTTPVMMPSSKVFIARPRKASVKDPAFKNTDTIKPFKQRKPKPRNP